MPRSTRKRVVSAAAADLRTASIDPDSNRERPKQCAALTIPKNTKNLNEFKNGSQPISVECPATFGADARSKSCRDTSGSRACRPEREPQRPPTGEPAPLLTEL